LNREWGGGAAVRLAWFNHGQVGASPHVGHWAPWRAMARFNHGQVGARRDGELAEITAASR
jgi:hypothetical protein